MADATAVQYNHPSGLVHRADGILYGTYTAADFTITLGFIPKYFKLVGLTDRIQAEWFNNPLLGTSNVEGLLRVANGTTTYEDVGITLAGKVISVDISVVNAMTANDDVYWEAWG